MQARGNVEKTIYSTNPFEYAVKCATGDEEIYYNSNSTVLTSEEEQFVFGSADFSNNVEPISDDKEEYYAAFFNKSDLTNYTAKNDKVVTGADSYTPKTMSGLLTGINTGNCSPTALTNICGYHYSQGKTKILVNKSIYDTYDALVEATGFDINKEYSALSGVSYQKAMKSLKAYVEDCSYRITLDRYSFDGWSDFKRDLGNNKLVLMAIGGEKLDVNNDWVDASHQLVGIGYRIMNDGEHYIRVYDGWNASTNRFLNFDSPYLDHVYGASVTIS